MREQGVDFVLLSSVDDDLPPVLAFEQVRHLGVPMERNFSPFADLLAIWRLYQIFRKERPDVLHTNTVKAGLLTMLAGWLARVPNRVYAVGGIKFMSVKYQGNKKQFLKLIERGIYALAHEVWPNSPSLMRFIRANDLCGEHKVRMVGKGSTNGINLHDFSIEKLDQEVLRKLAKSVNHQPDQHRYLLFVGRLVGDKGIVELVEAFLHLHEEFPDIILWLVGPLEFHDDPLPEATIKTIEQHPAIRAFGWSDQVAYYMALADVFIFPSHREGFPNVLLQAGAMKLPIICSRIVGNTDIVQDGETGHLFEEGDKDELTNCVRAFLTGGLNVKSTTAKLWKTIHQHFARERVNDYILTEYQRLTDRL